MQSLCAIHFIFLSAMCVLNKIMKRRKLQVFVFVFFGGVFLCRLLSLCRWKSACRGVLSNKCGLGAAPPILSRVATDLQKESWHQI